MRPLLNKPVKQAFPRWITEQTNLYIWHWRTDVRQHQKLRTVAIIQMNTILCWFIINKILNTAFVLQVYIYNFISWVWHSKAPGLGCKNYLYATLNRQVLFSVIFGHDWMVIRCTNAWAFCMCKGIKVSLQQVESITWMLINKVKICAWMFKLIFIRRKLCCIISS